MFPANILKSHWAQNVFSLWLWTLGAPDVLPVAELQVQNLLLMRFWTQFYKSVGNISESGLLFYSHGRNLLQFLVHRRKVPLFRPWACLNFSLLQFLSICPFTPISFMKAWLLLSSSRLFHLHLFPLHLPPPLSFTPLCRWHQLWTSRINNLLLYVALSSFLFFILRLQNHPGDPSDVCRPLKGFWVRVELLLLTPPLSEQLKKAQTSHWCRAMQIKPRGAVDECVRGVLLSAHFHFFFCPPCCAGEEEVLTEPLCSLRKVNIEQRNHLRMRSGLRTPDIQQLCLQTTTHFKGTVHPKCSWEVFIQMHKTET